MRYIDELWLSKKIPSESLLNEMAFMKGLKSGQSLKFDSPVNFIVGENGTGKSTLLEAVAYQLGYNLEGGSKNFNFSTIEETSELATYLSIAKEAHPKDGFFFRGESFFNVSTEVEKLGVSGYGKKPFHQQSHGEAVVSLFEHRFRGRGLYILDEPESALSPLRTMAVMCYMKELVQRESQFIIATHSPILLAYPKACIYQLSDKGIERLTYRETELYNAYKGFLDNPEGLIRNLFQ